jgi:uncharacterized membrane-anchored protein YitT (DUF2179 family)
MAMHFIENLKVKVETALGRTEFQPVSRYQKAKQSWRVQRTIRDYVRSGLFLLLGVLCAAFGLKSFLMPNGFIDGGVTGISLLINNKTGLPLAALIIVFNLPFILLGWHQISKGFSVKSVLAIGLLAIAVAFIPYRQITDDKLLVSVLVVFLGAGIGLLFAAVLL